MRKWITRRPFWIECPFHNSIDDPRSLKAYWLIAENHFRRRRTSIDPEEELQCPSSRCSRRATEEANFAGDTWHLTVEDAKEQAEFEYDLGEWRELPAELAEPRAVLEFLLREKS
jgi:hypothetical protein